MTAILRVYKSLVVRDIPDDVIDLILEFIGDISETDVELVNKRCTHKVNQRSVAKDRNKSWIYGGHLCTICERYLALKTQRGMQRHFNSQAHQFKLAQHLKNSKILPTAEKDLFEMWKANLTMVSTLYNQVKATDIYFSQN